LAAEGGGGGGGGGADGGADGGDQVLLVMAAVGLVSSRALSFGTNPSGEIYADVDHIPDQTRALMEFVDPEYKLLVSRLVGEVGVLGAISDLKRRALARDAAFMEMADADIARYAALHAAYVEMSHEERTVFIRKEVAA